MYARFDFTGISLIPVGFAGERVLALGNREKPAKTLSFTLERTVN